MLEELKTDCQNSPLTIILLGEDLDDHCRDY